MTESSNKPDEKYSEPIIVSTSLSDNDKDKIVNTQNVHDHKIILSPISARQLKNEIVKIQKSKETTYVYISKNDNNELNHVMFLIMDIVRNCDKTIVESIKNTFAKYSDPKKFYIFSAPVDCIILIDEMKISGEIFAIDNGESVLIKTPTQIFNNKINIDHIQIQSGGGRSRSISSKSRSYNSESNNSSSSRSSAKKISTNMSSSEYGSEKSTSEKSTSEKSASESSSVYLKTSEYESTFGSDREENSNRSSENKSSNKSSSAKHIHNMKGGGMARSNNLNSSKNDSVNGSSSAEEGLCE
jgi:hypothetical protein